MQWLRPISFHDVRPEIRKEKIIIFREITIAHTDPSLILIFSAQKFWISMKNQKKLHWVSVVHGYNLNNQT